MTRKYGHLRAPQAQGLPHCFKPGHRPYKPAAIDPHLASLMNTLANHRFVKMNGLGNEIVVVDMRAQP